MSEGRLGAFVLEHRYTLVQGAREEHLALIAVVKAWFRELGIAHFEVWRNPDHPLQVTEVQGYDSWSHYMRLNQKQLPPKIKEVYHDLGHLIDGGFEAVKTTSWEHEDVPDWTGTF